MFFRKSESAENYLYPGRPAAGRVGEKILSTLAPIADVLVVARGSVWSEVSSELPESVADKIRTVHGGADFVNQAIGLASGGLRVAACSTVEDAVLFERTFSRRPFPLSVVVHTAGPAGPPRAGVGFRLCAGTPQASVDFALIAQRISEAALLPGICEHRSPDDGASIGTLLEPEPELVLVWLPEPQDKIPTPTPAQSMLFGEQRRRIPAVVDLDRPAGVGAELHRHASSLAQAGIDPYFREAVPALIERAFEEFGSLTGRFHASAAGLLQQDADYFVVTSGPSDVFEVCGAHVASRARRKVGVVAISVSDPFPEREVAGLLMGCRAVTVLDEGGPGRAWLSEAVRSALHKRVDGSGEDRHTHESLPSVIEARVAGSAVGTGDLVALFENMLPGGRGLRKLDLGISFAPDSVRVPSLESLYQTIRKSYPDIDERGVSGERVEIQSGGPVTTLLITGKDVGAVRAVADSLATSAFEELQRPVATAFDGSASIAGFDSATVISIGTVSPSIAALRSIDAIVADQADVAARWLENPRLAPSATLILPASQASRMTRSMLPTAADRSVHILTVDVEVDPAASVGLTALVSAWLKSDALFSDVRDALCTRLVTDLVERVGWSRTEQERVSHLVVSLEGKPWSPPDDFDGEQEPEPIAPDAIRQSLERPEDFADAGRLWRTVGYAYAADQPDILSPDPYISSNIVPARTGWFRAASARLEQMPELYPENCTGCNRCAAFCPEGAIRTAVRSMQELVAFGIEQVGKRGKPTTQLDRAASALAKQAHRNVARDELRQHRTVGDALKPGFDPIQDAMNLAEESRRDLAEGFDAVLDSIGALPLVRTEAFFDAPESQSKGSGELFLFGFDPDACTSCGLCVSVCPDGALGMRAGAREEVALSRSQVRTVAANQSDVAAAAYDGSMDFLMGRKASEAVVGSEGSSRGSGVKLTVRLVCSLIEAEVAPRFAALAGEASDLSGDLRRKINALLHSAVQVNDIEAFGRKLDALKSERVTAADIAGMIDDISNQSVDAKRLGRLTAVLNELESTRRDLESGRSGDGRARMAAVFGTGSLLAANRRFPFNPYPFPWIHIGNGSPVPLAEGLFQNVTATMGNTFATFRKARKLARGLDYTEEDALLQWTDLTQEEWASCPPVCVFTEDEADIPRDWLQKRIPIKIFVLDGNGSLLEDGWGVRLWPLARPDWFVLHSAASEFDHFAPGIRAGLAYRGPAVFRLYTPEPNVHGFKPDATISRMESAVRSRAFPLIRYDPDPALEWTDRWSLAGNEEVEEDWASPIDTPAHWMLGERRFDGLFETGKTEAGAEEVDLLEWIAGSSQSNEALRPVVRLEHEGRRISVRVREPVVQATRDARGFWRLLQELAGVRSTALARARREAETEIEKQVAEARAAADADARAEIDRVTDEHTAIYHRKLTQKLLALSGFGPGTEAYERKLREYTDPE